MLSKFSTLLVELGAYRAHLKILFADLKTFSTCQSFYPTYVTKISILHPLYITPAISVSLCLQGQRALLNLYQSNE